MTQLIYQSSGVGKFISKKGKDGRGEYETLKSAKYKEKNGKQKQIHPPLNTYKNLISHKTKIESAIEAKGGGGSKRSLDIQFNKPTGPGNTSVLLSGPVIDHFYHNMHVKGASQLKGKEVEAILMHRGNDENVNYYGVEGLVVYENEEEEVKKKTNKKKTFKKT